MSLPPTVYFLSLSLIFSQELNLMLNEYSVTLHTLRRGVTKDPKMMAGACKKIIEFNHRPQNKVDLKLT